MSSILVTGGTGRLGVPTVEHLRAAGHDVRVLSRRDGPGHVIGDLRTGAGVREAVAGTDTVVHLATANGLGAGEAALMKTLLAASRDADIGQLVFISIVGIDRIPLGYYRQKLEAERVLEASGLPHTILRATQFHDLVVALFAAQRFSPVVFAPNLSFQPIATGDVAVRLGELVAGTPAGRAADVGGPEQLAARELARQWADAASVRRRIVPVSLPGKTFAAFAAGHNLAPGSSYGTTTFSEFLARHGVRA
ncbi:SDR family oxidoreductase [Agromyces sp. NPDC058484]|uniref:SDR family oxidoreductase n=1 Tax=Agromyces sp. NPDC058484 TaxID=3346524 RepID=UPI0036601AE5